MSRYQPIYNIAEICNRKDVHDIVLCPGSRCAPLVLAFTRHPAISTRTITDERSAAFIALGLAQGTKKTAAVVTTSGTAAYNLAPAIAEAFFNEVPLLILTADRPAEWAGQQDGQTIYQENLYGKHVKRSYQLPQDYDHADSRWAVNRIINDAINLTQQLPKGPVHVNLPFREPLYPAAKETVTFDQNIRIASEAHAEQKLNAERHEALLREWQRHHHILCIAGQQDYDVELHAALKKIVDVHKLPVVTDITSNLHPVEGTIAHADLFLGQAGEDVKKSLQPDLLITFGKAVLSKNLKQFIRNHAPKKHWHIQTTGDVADTFQSITEIIRLDATTFLNVIDEFIPAESFDNQKQRNFYKLWEIEERRTIRTINEFFPYKDFAELELVRETFKSLPANAHLHLANSMSVRYANFIGLTAAQSGIKVFSNRGTSGIDGCTSTAVGQCFANPSVPQILITGDLAFFYDRNAFWNNYPKNNLRVLLLNNHGGGIFKMIDGPGNVPEADEYFVTRQPLSAKFLCDEFNIRHLALDLKRKLQNLLKDFFDFDGDVKVLELETTPDINKNIFDTFKAKIKKSYEL